jgi:hypothetical protein
LLLSPTSQFPSRLNGPFLIIKQTGPLSYRIQRLSDGRMFRSHVARMKPYHIDCSFVDEDDFLNPVSWLSHAKDFHDNLNNPGFVDEFLTFILSLVLERARLLIFLLLILEHFMSFGALFPLYHFIVLFLNKTAALYLCLPLPLNHNPF